MRVCGLYDIHGNLPALAAVLREVSQEAVDRIVVGGDVVFGPMTRDALKCLRDLQMPVHFIQGNAEVSVLADMSGSEPKQPMPEPILEVLRWEAQQLRGFESILAGWPMTVRLSIPGLGEVMFCHATPRDENEVFLRTTPDEVLEPIFAASGADLVVCGHTHMQFDRMIGRVRVVNAGSVGMPFGVPGAYWLMLGPEVELRHTMYDLSSAAARIRETPYPQRQEFAANHVLQPPSEAAMIEMFEKFALR